MISPPERRHPKPVENVQWQRQDVEFRLTEEDGITASTNGDEAVTNDARKD
jgi:hypothetical protein